MLRRIPTTLGVLALLAGAVPGAAASTPVLHDFDPTTLRAYVDFRFSSAVPPALISHVLWDLRLSFVQASKA